MTVNRRVLVVHPDPGRCSAIGDILGDEYEVRSASSADEVRMECETHAPFAVALVHIGIPEGGGIPILREFQRTWPSTARLAAADRQDFDLLVRALHVGEVERFLRDEELEDCVKDCVHQAAALFQQGEDERLLTEQLRFSREALIELTDALEDRLQQKIACLAGLGEFSSGLNQARSLGEVADLAAVACTQLLGGRGVKVLLSHPAHDDADSSVLHGSVGGRSIARPVETPEGTVGHIEIDTSNGHPRFREEDHRILDTLASAAGVAAGNLIHQRERDDAHNTTIFALARLAENRDDDTGRHLERVSSYCLLIAEGLREDGHFEEQLTEAWVRDLVRSAPLHDIGKVGVPDSILLKPGKLNAEEWDVMRTHTRIGAETLSRILESSGEQGFLRMGHDIALSHHERWNGSGYPEALEGEAIPLAARILALADCYDALTTRRPYKEPWTHAASMELILSEKGEHFDPRIVVAFERRADRADEIRRELTDDSSLTSLADCKS